MKTKRTSKLVALLLTLVMVATLLPTPALAEETLVSYAVEGGSITFDKDTGDVTGCTDGVTTLVIPATIEGVAVTGIGEWAFSGRTSLESVTIPDSVTGIRNYAFYNCTNLTDVTIGTGATYIGSNAFYGCSSLESVTIPDRVTNIGTNAFNGCSGLKSVTIGSGVTGIGDGAFYGCTRLTGVTIPGSVTTIGNYAFQGCTGLTGVTLENGVTTIGEGAFQYTGLTSMTIPGSVTTIGDYAFQGCSGMTSVTLGKDMASIGAYAFESTGLTSVTIPANVTSIGANAFDGTTLAEATFLGNAPTVGTTAFPSATDIYYLAGKTGWDDPKWSGAIPYYPATGGKLTLDIDTGTSKITVTGFEGPVTAADIPATIGTFTVTKIGSYAFNGCATLTAVTIPLTVTEIQANAFKGTGLTSMTIPGSVTTIEAYAFDSCPSLTHVFFLGNAPSSVGQNAFAAHSSTQTLYYDTTKTGWTGNPDFADYHLVGVGTYEPYSEGIEGGSIYFNKITGEIVGCDMLVEEVVIPDAIDGIPVTGIGAGVFASAPNLYAVTIGNNVTSIGEGAFCCPITTLTIPDSVVTIGDKAFQGCDQLTDVTIGSHVTTIGAYAFKDCTALTGVTIPDSVTYIGTYAFYECYALTSVNIPDGVTTIEDDTFCNCTSLESVTIPDSVTKIGDEAFNDCSSLARVCFAGKRPTMGADVFPGTTDIYYLAGKTGWSSPAKPYYPVTGGNLYFDKVNGTIEGCDATVTVANIPAKIDGTDVVGIDGFAFQDCTALTRVTIPQGVTVINGYAFLNCTALTDVTIPGSVTDIGEGVFYGCISLTEATIPSSVISLGDAVFYGCISLTEATIPSSVISLGDAVFSGCTALKRATILADVTTLGEYMFMDCADLTDVTIPDTVTTIGEMAFYECASLTSMAIPNNVVDIGDGAFGGCTGLTDVTMGSSLKNIGAAAFYGCTSLEAVTLPGYVQSIGDSAFEDSHLQRVTFRGDAPADANVGTKIFPLGTIVYYDKSKTGWGNPWHSYTAWETGLLPYEVTGGKIFLDNGTYEIVDCETTVTAANIPEAISGCTVTGIDASAFSGCTALQSVTFPSTVTHIGNHAFNGCKKLTGVTIPSAVTRIGDYAFSGTGLTSLTVPGTLTTVGEGAFSGCTSLATVTIQSGATAMGEYVFQGCTSLTNVTIPGTMTTISKSAFSGCTALESVIIPDGVTTIGEGAFGYCGLTSLTIPGSVTAIGATAFAQSTVKLTGVTFLGNAPTASAGVFPAGTTVTYYPGKAGWTNPWYGYTTQQIASATTYTVSFAAAGGSGAMTAVNGVAGSYTLPACTFAAPSGKQFKAWSVGGAEKAVGATITVTANVTLTAVWEDIPTYGISLSQTGTYIFPGEISGYMVGPWINVTVTNTGTGDTGGLSVTLSGYHASSFFLSKNGLPGIAPGGSADFMVAPDLGLAIGTHTATVTVSGAHGILASFDVTFTVIDPAGNQVVPGPPIYYPAENKSTVLLKAGSGVDFSTAQKVLVACYEGTTMKEVVRGTIDENVLTVEGQDLTQGTWRVFLLDGNCAPICNRLDVHE